MSRRLASVLLALFAFAAMTGVAVAKSTTYKGQATNEKGDFNYGKVKGTVKDGKLTSLKVESVTSSCGSIILLRTYIYSSKDKTGKIVGGSNKVKKGKVVFNFKPVPDTDDTLLVDLKVSKSKLSGTVAEVGVCVGKAKLSAKK